MWDTLQQIARVSNHVNTSVASVRTHVSGQVADTQNMYLVACSCVQQMRALLKEKERKRETKRNRISPQPQSS